MRVLLLTPTALPSVTGNAVTVERWRRSLTALGHEVRVLAASELPAAALAAALREFSPDVLHAHHAFRSGALLLDPIVEAARRESALVVSPAGTDLYVDIDEPSRREVVGSVCRCARALVTQGEETARRLEELFPEAAGRIARVPKAFAWLGDEPFDLRAAAGCAPGDLLFFHPAGVRPVKGNLECLLALEGAWAERPRVRALFAGPVLDREYGSRFAREIARLRRFARWLPGVPVGAMRAAYEGSDVVLNASWAEGLANVLLEAAAAGRPVLASDVPGNRGPLLGDDGDPPFGLTYDPCDPGDLARKVVGLADDPCLRRELAAAGRARAARWPGPAVEAEALSRAYAAALSSHT